jgi:phosphoglycolate phosphatase-like HAD superfamily hydrolase
MLNKKNIIFDFDGTIADTVPVMFTLIGQLATELGYEKRITQVDLDWVKEHELTEIPKHFEIPLIKLPFLLMKGRNLLNKQMFSVPPCRGILEMLQSLKKKGYILAILSSNRRDSIQEFIVKHNLESYFDFVHSELNLFGKDKALLSLLKQNNMTVKDSLYVGDEIRDFKACQKIDMDCVSAAWGLNSENALRKHGAKWIVGKPQEVIDILHKL